MRNFVDLESGVTVVDFPYRELDFEASNFKVGPLVPPDPWFPKRPPVVIVKAPE